MNRVLFIISALLLSLGGYAQQELHSKKKKAIADYNQAKELIALSQYNAAQNLLVSAIERDKSFDEALLLLTQLYLQKGEIALASNLVSNSAERIEPTFLNRAHFDLATYLWRTGSYQKAAKYLSLVQGSVLNKENQEVALLSQSIEFSLKESGVAIAIEKELLKPQLNQFDMQYFPSIDASGNLVFTARDKRWGGDEQIMFTRDSAGFWQKPQSISTYINSDLNEGTAAISADGTTLVFTGCNRSNGFGSCDLYISKRLNGIWQSPELMPSQINSKFWESQPSLSARGDALYFTSTRPGIGGEDIWFSIKKDGRWQEAINLGPSINTTDDDASPFIFPDDETLFFSSKGRPGMGGFDIYQSKRQNDSWTEPANLGTSVNDQNDQIGYSVSVSGQAYFSSTDGVGRVLLNRLRLPDIYVPKIKLNRLVVEVFDSLAGNKLDASVRLTTLDDDIQMLSAGLGRYELLINADPESIVISKSGYISKVIENAQPINRVYLTRSIETKLFDPIYFELNKFSLSNFQKEFLGNVAFQIREAPIYQVLIEGFADSLGDKESNQILAQKRVDSVKAELIRLGVATDLIDTKVFGEQKAIIELGDNVNSKEFRSVRVSLVTRF